MLTRLADILIIQAIRAWLDSASEARQGWLATLHDPQIGRALVAIHKHPAQAWSVDGLSQSAALSRSAFAARFTALVGHCAMSYLTDWRLSLATRFLAETDLPLAEIAARVGYGSEPVFGRAYTRVYGQSPGHVRRSG
ncbi:MAG: AraC family transcriptional regulator [Pseudomonadota bacterium]